MAKDEHLIVIPLQPLKFGQEFEIWPLHVTIVPWFHCSAKDKPKLDDLLSSIAKRHKRFSVIVGPKADFGKHDKEFLVQLINQNKNLTDLHLDIFETLEGNGFPIHQKDYLGNNYKSHFIYKKSNMFAEGSTIPVSSFSLIKQNRLKISGTMIKRLDKEYKLK